MAALHTSAMEGTEHTTTVAREHAPERFPFTKFLPPVLDDRVSTDHVVRRIDEAVTTRALTILTAPAGSGKTTALASWAATAGDDVVWIRLGPDDNEPTVLAAALVEAGRRRLGDEFGGRVAQLLAYAGAAPTPRQLATALVNDLGDHGSATLVFDDVHEVTDADTADVLDELLDHLPPDVRVVLSSRVEPDLSLARRRVRDQVAEFGLDDLLLDRDAVEHVLSRDAPVDDAAVDAVLTASGGWAAAVRLATTQRGADTTPSRVSPEVLSDLERFLAEEVLAGLPDTLRGFLLETSILDELSPAVCDAVTGRADSRRVLEDLDRRNLFLTRHRGATDDTWRTHDLFAAFLRDRLATERSREEIGLLHRRAAGALPAFRALRHLTAAGDHATAASLIVELAYDELETSTILQVQPALRALPDHVIDADHRLALLRVWPEHVSGRAHEVVRALEPLWGRLVSAGRHTQAAEVGDMLAEAHLQLGDLDGTGRAIEHALEHCDDAWRPIVLGVAAWWNYYRDEWHRVSDCIHEAVDRTLASDAVSLRRAIGPALSPTLLFVDRGPAWVADAVERLADGLRNDDHATVTGMRPVRAGASLLRLDVGEATRELRQCLAESVEYGQIAWKHQEAELLLVSICLGTGDLGTVERVLDDALPRLDEPVYRQYRHTYALAAMRLQWLSGEHQRVVATSDRYLTGPPRTGHLEETVVRGVAGAMVARIEGRTDDAVELLRQSEQAQRDGRCWLFAGMPGLDRASILLESGRVAAALESTLPTLHEAARVGPGILVPEARANRGVLERCVRAGIHVDMLRQVLAASAPAHASHEPLPIPGTDEVLSPREREVLAQVAAGASNREVAAALFIGEATVKSHLTRILRKLDADSRTHAAARARELRLL